MKIVEKKLTELIPYANNPRHNDEAVDAVAESIKEFGFKVPCVIDGNGVVVCGHTRIKAARKLGLESVPCVIADDLSEEQIRAFRLAENQVGSIATFDLPMLAAELQAIDGIDMIRLGFDAPAEEEEEDTINNEYNNEIKLPQYEIRGENPTVDELVDTSKADSLIEEITQAKIPDDIKAFLCKAATRHYVFTYKRIAEYYANADAEVQRLMEKSALVFIDYDNALANGYVKLSSVLDKLIGDNNE